MNIVIEGPDATGKSSLARVLAEATGYKIVESEGPPTKMGEIAQRIERRELMTDTIFVRHPIISHPIYEAARMTRARGVGIGEVITPSAKRRFYASNAIIIYCHSLNPHPHIAKPHDSHDHILMINDERNLIHDLYARWGLIRAHIVYRIFDDMQRIVNFVNTFDPVGDVEAFHRKMGIEYEGKPRALDQESGTFRLKFMREEVNEYERHLDAALFELDKLTRAPMHAVGDFAFDNAALVHELAETLDALVDLTYVALGTAHLHGFLFKEAWRRVHAANMRKVPLQTPTNSEQRFKLKISKPPGWEPPRHEDLVEEHAHSTEHRP